MEKKQAITNRSRVQTEAMLRSGYLDAFRIILGGSPKFAMIGDIADPAYKTGFTQAQHDLIVLANDGLLDPENLERATGKELV